jgi:NAD(P)-dependent dehydrogenase (short-subunit alcohol dehydrogenase family)
MADAAEPGALPGGSREFLGRNAVVTGAASGIGGTVARELHSRGAKVLALDITPEIIEPGPDPRWVGRRCDVTASDQVEACLTEFARLNGPLDLLVSNAGVFTAGSTIDKLDLETWERGLRINLTSHFIVLQSFLAQANTAPPASIVVVGSRNVAAPGPGAAAYSVPKAGLVQLVRVAALELGARQIRINVVHPDAVFDTALYTPEMLERSAARYGITVEQYKKQNILGVKVRPQDVSNVICLLLGETFSRTTGAQVPVDGGHMRVI